MSTLLGTPVYALTFDEHLAAWTTAAVALCVLIGIIVRVVLVPYLREQLIKPVQEVHKQVTENGGKNDPPTVPDKLHALQDSVDVLTETVGDLADAVKAVRANDSVRSEQATLLQANLSSIVLVLDEHLRWSRDYVARQEAGHDPEAEE